MTSAAAFSANIVRLEQLRLIVEPSIADGILDKYASTAVSSVSTLAHVLTTCNADAVAPIKTVLEFAQLKAPAALQSAIHDALLISNAALAQSDEYVRVTKVVGASLLVEGTTTHTTAQLQEFEKSLSRSGWSSNRAFERRDAG